MLSLYRSALRLRREQTGWHAADFSWLESPAEVLAFERGDGLRCVVNLSEIGFPLTGLGRVILSSEPELGTDLPTDTAAWLTA
jgi:alpha-glucosidase